MLGQKLIRILQTLDLPAFRRLGEAFESPYFTHSPLLLKLYGILKKEFPVFESSRLQKEALFHLLYPEKPYNDGALRVLLREFTRVTEDFILLEFTKKDELTRQKALAKWYAEHNLYAEFEKETQAVLARLEAQPYRDVDYFKQVAELHAAYFFNIHTEKHTLDDHVLVTLMDSVDKGYILFKLRVASEMKNRQRILSRQYELPMLDVALAARASELLEDNPCYLLYKQLLALYDTENVTSSFAAIKELYIECLQKLQPFDRALLMTHLINYAVGQLNSGNRQFTSDILALYRVALDHHLVLSNGKIEAAVYQNIVSVGCQEMEFQWTEQFIHSYAPFLENDLQGDSVAMALAYLNFYQSNYEKTIELLAGHQFSHLLLQLNSRIMLVKAWFEKFLLDPALLDLLVYQLEANEKYIRRNHVISSGKKAESLNFLLVTKKLAQLVYNKKPVSEIRNRLAPHLGAAQRLPSRAWLELKLEEYGRKQEAFSR